jgi:hypothetical protein
MALLEKKNRICRTHCFSVCSEHNEPAFRQRCAHTSLGVINLEIYKGKKFKKQI